MIPVMYKTGVSMVGIQPQLALGLMMCARGYEEFGATEMWVTSLTDGKHGEGSLHYKGLAFDLRTRMYNEDEKEGLAKILRRILGREWDVVVEATHIHVEFDPK